MREELAGRQVAHLRLAEMGCRAVGSTDPALDARIVVTTLVGLMLQHLTGPGPTSRKPCFAPR